MREIININRKWAFTKQANSAPSEMPGLWDFVNLPHTWNAIDGQDGENDYYRGICWYAKEIDREELPKADRYFLEFKGANSSADVYVGAEKLYHHDGGYSTFRVDITKALEKSNLISVAVDNGENETVYPQMADFTFYGGLYRDVNIIAVCDSHFDLEYYGGPGIAVTPEIIGNDAKVKINCYLSNAKDNQELLITVKNAQGEPVASSKAPASNPQAEVEIKNVHLWNGRKDPYLYTAEAILCENGEVLDNVSARFGCRSFKIDAENGFILNGKEYPLHGVSRHQDRWGIGNALLPEHHEEDIELICELGATTIRLAHYQHDQYFYDLCDENGLVIWAEIPYISKHMPTGRENTISQMKELITQNYNHPCIVVWGLSNEISMNGSNDDLIDNHKVLNDLVHEMDKTRLTTCAVVSMCDIHDPYIQIPDVISYNHYFGWYGGDTSMNGPWFDNFHKEFPNIPIGMSEYGCEALNWHTSNPTQGDYTEEYQAHYHEELIKQLFTRKYIWATHVWNMFDFGADARNEGGENGQNHKGLVTFDRKYKKDSFYAYKAWLSDEPFVHICGKRYVDRMEETTKVTVYSNLPSVELFANGKSLGVKESPEHFFYFDVPNTEAQTKLVARAGDCTDESVIRKVDKFNEAYRLKEKGAILNWFDITEVEGYFSINDKVGDIMKSPEGAALFGQMMSKMAEAGGAGAAGMEIDKDAMMQMMNGFTVLRLTNLLGTAGVKFTKEQLLGINAQLNKIKKP
ncbi:MAG: glycoside hydrolase family 2 protein [Eubacterium sp.]|nr:glycoside hydrolase family 2 protein [Eubacterium sp.]